MSSGENLDDMSERKMNSTVKQKRNCLGHQFDPGTSSVQRQAEDNGMNDVSFNHQANGYRENQSSTEDEDDYVNAIHNGEICNGLSHSTVKDSDSLETCATDSLINGISDVVPLNAPNSFPLVNCSDVRPKQPLPNKTKPLSQARKSGGESNGAEHSSKGDGSSSSSSKHNGSLHNLYSRPVHCSLSSANGQLNRGSDPGQVNVGDCGPGPVNGGCPSSYVQCVRPQTLMLANRHQPGNFPINMVNDEMDLCDLVDEGAVCDYDKFLLSEEHNSPSENSRSEEADSEFLDYHFPSTQLDSMAMDFSQCSGSSQLQVLPTAHPAHSVNGHRANVSASCDVDFDNSDYLKLFDELDGEHYSAGDDSQDNWEDTGDFIDTDLPARAPGLLSSSTGSSSSLSDDEVPSPMYNSQCMNSKENDLSTNRLSSVPFQNRQGDCGKFTKKGSNLCFSGDTSNCSSQRHPPFDFLHHHVVNSSESENGDDCQIDLGGYNCDVNEVFFDGGAASLGGAASSRNIQPIIASNGNGAGVGYCGSAGLRHNPAYFVHSDGRGVSADCSSDVMSQQIDQTVPPASASCQHSSCSMAVNADPCVNNLSSDPQSNMSNVNPGGYHVPVSVGYHVPVSNFQNDKSNNHQKVFIKFNVTSQDQKRISGHHKRDASHLGSPNSPDESELGAMEDEGQEQYQQIQGTFQDDMVILAAEMARSRVNAESGVSEPIYEDIELLADSEESGNMAAAAIPSDVQTKLVDSSCRKVPLRVAPRRKERRSSSGGRSGIEKVMIWNEYEAYVLQVKQIATSACGPTAVLNVLKAFDVCVDKEEVCKKIQTNLRDELGSIPSYLFSRAVAGTTAEDLLQGIENLTAGKIRGRFFHFWPAREVQLLKWLGQWMKKGAVPLATLNLQKGVKCGWTIPDAWHHQMVYGVSSKGVYLTNPLENVSEETVLEQLVSDSVLLVRRQDVVNRFRDDTDLGEIIRHPDDRWRTINVLGQVVNVLRESNMPHPMYRAQLTSHVSIPAVYKAGITLFVQGETSLWQELQAAPDLVLRENSLT